MVELNECNFTVVIVILGIVFLITCLHVIYQLWFSGQYTDEINNIKWKHDNEIEKIRHDICHIYNRLHDLEEDSNKARKTIRIFNDTPELTLSLQNIMDVVGYDDGVSDNIIKDIVNDPTRFKTYLFNSMFICTSSTFFTPSKSMADYEYQGQKNEIEFEPGMIGGKLLFGNHIDYIINENVIDDTNESKELGDYPKCPTCDIPETIMKDIEYVNKLKEDIEDE